MRDSENFKKLSLDTGRMAELVRFYVPDEYLETMLHSLNKIGRRMKNE